MVPGDRRLVAFVFLWLESAQTLSSILDHVEAERFAYRTRSIGDMFEITEESTGTVYRGRQAGTGVLVWEDPERMVAALSLTGERLAGWDYGGRAGVFGYKSGSLLTLGSENAGWYSA